MRKGDGTRKQGWTQGVYRTGKRGVHSGREELSGGPPERTKTGE